MNIGQYEYILIGSILPMRVMFSRPPLAGKIVYPDLQLDGKTILYINNSRILLSYITNKPIINYLDLKNIAIEFVIRPWVDLYCYIKSYNYDIEIETAFDIANHSVIQFSVQGEFDIDRSESEEAELFKYFFELFNLKQYLYLKDIIADYRRAISEPAETAFYCYRAIETIRIYGFQDKWNELNNTLGYQKDDYDLLLELSKSKRHGNNPLISGTTRSEIMKFTRVLIDKFLRYLYSISFSEVI